MESFKSCCGVQYAFHHRTLCCYGKQLCIIPRGGKYFSYQNSYTYCYKCFNQIPGDTINLGGDPTNTQIVLKKEEFVEMKNDLLELEPFVTCQSCGWKLHEICAMYSDSIWPQGFTCDNCLRAKNMKRRDNKFTAKRLPTTKLGTFIETRVNNFLKKKEAEAGEVCIRVVSSSEKIVEVKAGMKGRFVETGELCGTFPYKAKALFAFEEIDGTDVCFFGMHVQEYGSECPTPNTRRVYISYLDSIHFFRPRQFRTAVYHQILLGYLEYVKELGYTMAHIWACPPSEGDDYIFHCHPPEQKVPKAKRLQEWYKRMLDKGIIERIVFDYKDILKQAIEDNLASAAELPYFDGDFWPNVLEDSIKELDQEEEEKRRQAEAAEAAASTSVSEEVEVTVDGTKKGQKKGTKKGKKRAKKSNKSKANQRKNNKKSNIPLTGNDLSTKIFTTMEKHKDVFFVIRLHSAQSAASLGPIQDPDPFIQCELMDGRDDFLTMARDKHYEFSSLRRAKYSSMLMLYEIHNQGQDRFVYSCDNCKNNVETRYHCTVCDDFDLCVGCYQKTGHPHKMDKLGLDLDEGSSSSPGNKANLHGLDIQRCVESLVHSCQCQDADCRLPSCHKMKLGFAHTQVCKRKVNGGCTICKQLITLCCLHAKHCVETKCFVHYCDNIRYQLKQQLLLQRLQQNRLLHRRMQMMQMMGGGGSAAPSTPTRGLTAPPRPDPTVPQMMGSPMTPGMQSMGGRKPTSGVPLPALHLVRQVQEKAAQQHAQAIALTGIPVVHPTQPNHPTPSHQQLIRPSGHHVTNVGFGGPQRPANAPAGLSGIDQMQNRYPGISPARPMNNYTHQQHASMLMHRQQNLPQPQRGMSMANQQVRPVRPQQGGQVNQGGYGQLLLDKLIQTFRSASTPEEQQHVLHIINSNTQLMTAFTLYRQHRLQLQQQQLKQQQQQQQQNVRQGQAGQTMNSPVMNQQQQNVRQGQAGQTMNSPVMNQQQQNVRQGQADQTMNSPVMNQQQQNVRQGQAGQTMNSPVMNQQQQNLRQGQAGQSMNSPVMNQQQQNVRQGQAGQSMNSPVMNQQQQNLRQGQAGQSMNSPVMNQQQQNVRQGQAGQTMNSLVMNQQQQQSRDNLIQHPGNMGTKKVAIGHQHGMPLPQMQQRPQMMGKPQQQQQQQMLMGQQKEQQRPPPPLLPLGNNRAQSQATQQFLYPQPNQLGTNQIVGNPNMARMAGSMNPKMSNQMRPQQTTLRSQFQMSPMAQIRNSSVQIRNASLQSERFGGKPNPIFSRMGPPTLVSRPNTTPPAMYPLPPKAHHQPTSPLAVGGGSGTPQLDVLNPPHLVPNDPSCVAVTPE